MEKEHLKKFIKESLEKGYKKETVKKALLKIGETSNDIDQAFKEIGEVVPSASSFEAKAKKPIIEEANAVSNQTPVSQERNQEEYSPYYSIKRKRREVFNASKKTIIIILISSIFALVAGASFYIYKVSLRTDPISFIPQESPIYLTINLDPQFQQTKNLKALLQKFPNYNFLANKINERINELKKENSIPENADFNIAKEITFSVDKFPSQTEEPSLILILSGIDSKKVNQLREAFKNQVPEKENIQPKELKYRGKRITCYFDKLSNSNKLEETDIIAINDALILTDKATTSKKIIDAYLDHKNISSLPSYKKLKAKVSGDHLVVGYFRLDLVSLLEATNSLGTDMPSGDFSSFPVPLKSVFDSLKPKLKSGNAKPESIAMFAINANEKGLEAEAYYLNPEMKNALLSPFSLNNGLLVKMPRKIGAADIIYYSEGRNLENHIKAFLNASTTDAGAYKDFLKNLDQILKIDIEKNILPLFKNNYVMFVASQQNYKNPPIFGFIAKIDDENKVKEELLKIKIPKESTNPYSASLSQSYLKAKDARIKADLSQIEVIAAFIYSDKASYKSLSCTNRDYPQLKAPCNDIKESSGDYPIIHASKNDYCAYKKLNEPGAYFCVDSDGRALKTYLNPGHRNYCDGITFNCPANQGSKPKNILPLQTEQAEMAGFTKKIIDGQEIYSMPFISKNLPISFAVKNKILFLVLGENNLIDAINSYFSNNVKLQASKDFNDLFIDAPKKINGLNYVYPYGYLSLIKYGINFFINSYTQSMMQVRGESSPGLSQAMLEVYLAPIYEVIDKGIGPYLKALKVGGSYSYLAKDGIITGKSRIFIQELPVQEKKDCEDFWQNFISSFK